MRTGVAATRLDSTRLDSTRGGEVRRGAAEWWSISLLVFHRFQSIKLVALVLPSADHAGAVPFFCSATTSVVFRVPPPALPVFYPRSG